MLLLGRYSGLDQISQVTAFDKAKFEKLAKEIADHDEGTSCWKANLKRNIGNIFNLL